MADGLSDEERRRNQALRDKLKGQFERARAGEKARAPDARASEQRRADATVNHVLTPDGQTRMEKTPQGRQREEQARKMAERVNAKTDREGDKAQQHANVRKEFNQAKQRDRMRDRDDFER